MRVCRFMGMGEFLAYMQGITLKSDTDWRRAGQASRSKGFCFFPAGSDDEKPEDRIPYLVGVVNMNVCAVFDTDAPMKFSKGRYADQTKTQDVPIMEIIIGAMTGKPIGTRRVDEFSTQTYSRDTFRLVKAGYPDPMRNSINWMVRAMSEPEEVES